MTVTEASFVTSIVMTGCRRSNKTLQSTNDCGVYMDEWPETITHDRRVFTLYEVSTYANNIEEAKYV